MPNSQLKIKVVFQDQHLMVVEKSAGLVVDTTLADMLARQFKISLERGGIVHRLDKDTSGLLLVAKTQTSLNHLQSQFLKRLIRKHYLVLVHGHLKQGGVVTGAIGRHPLKKDKFTVLSSGRQAQTNYQPLQRLVISDQRLVEIFSDFSKIQLRKLSTTYYPNYTLLRCQPVTGRTHQIRVHLRYLGFSVVADEKYAGRKIVRLDKRWCPRQFLHASKIEFNHPLTGERMKFESPLPKDLEKALSFLKASI